MQRPFICALGNQVNHCLPATTINNASLFIHIAGCLCLLAVACYSYFFLRRVHAIYADNRRVQWCFSMLWFISAASQLAIPLGVIPGYIPGTHHVDSVDSPVVATSVVAAVFYDSSVFLAISYKIASMQSLMDERITWRTLASGKALPRISRAILQGGQQYYL